MRKALVIFGAPVVIGVLSACPPSAVELCDDGACTPAADGGGSVDGDADIPDRPVPTGCVEDADTSSPQAAPCMDDGFALFVDSTAGNDSNSGARAKPFKSIRQALKVVDSTGKRRVYICGTSTFDEHVKITTRASLFGGFACGDWSYDGKKARISPSDVGYALHIDAVSAQITISDLELVAIEGTSAEPSSITAFVANSPSIEFRRLKIEAGAGANGKDGAQGATGAPVSGDLDGNAGGDLLGGDAKVCTCSTGGSTTGGAGGDVNGTDTNGTAGLPTIAPAVPDTASGAGQTQTECNNGTSSARPGSQAPAASPAPKAKVGTLDASGWHPASGASGQNGMPGQGGGGGGSRTNAGSNNGAGGSGGCGGCGGAGGGGGGAGGSSIALLTVASPVRLIGSQLFAATAGNGGGGREGGSGGGGGGGGGGFKNGCDGNVGGSGGKGGSGAGGPGGVSVAVFHAGDPPANEGSTYEHGTGGTGGTSPDNDGPDGLEGDVVPSP